MERGMEADDKVAFPRGAIGDQIRLYNVKRDSIIKPVGSERAYRFHNIDGMYSRCTDLSSGDTVHLAAWTDVYVLE